MPGVANRAGLLVNYNGYEFPVTMEPVRVSERPLYDSAGRAVTACEYTFTVSATIYPDTVGGDTDAATQMLYLRQQLTKPACTLVVGGTGMGGAGNDNDNFVVNSPGGNVWDAAWGPKPKVIELQQIGDNQAWKITWQVVTVIPEECPEETKPKKKRILEWCWTPSWDVDDRGLTTRTITGHVVIPITRLRPDDVTLPDHAELLRHTVMNISCPEGFRRTPGRAQLSEDRRRLEYTVTDRQMDSPWSPPPGVILCSGSHRVNNNNAMNWIKYSHTLTASYTMSRSERKADAWQCFRELWISRWKNMTGEGQFFWAMPLTLSIDESLWTMTTTFTLNYVAIAAKEGRESGEDHRKRAMATAVANSGLWEVPVKNTWTDWYTRLGRGKDARGHAQLRFLAEDDRIQDPCEPPIPPAPDANVLKSSNRNEFARNVRLTRPQKDDGPKLPGDRPPPEDSWLNVRTRIRVVTNDDTSVLKLLPRDGREVKYQPRKRGMDESLDGFTADYAPSPAGLPPRVIQVRAEADYKVIFEGEALRVGYKVGVPVITEIGGVKAWPIRDEEDYFEQEFIANLLSPICLARWRQTYVLEATPKVPIGPPDHPVHGSFGGKPDRIEGFVVSK